MTILDDLHVIGQGRLNLKKKTQILMTYFWFTDTSKGICTIPSAEGFLFFREKTLREK